MTMTKLMTLGRDAEIRYTPSGMAVSMLSLCYRLPKHKNEKDYPVQWIRANFFGDRAEKINGYLTKGRKIVATVDHVHINEYTKKDGAQAYNLQATVTNIELIGGQNNKQNANTSTHQQNNAVDEENYDDDIPF